MPADSTTISFQSVLCCDADIRKNLYWWHDHVPLDRWVRDEGIDSVGSIHDDFFFLKKKNTARASCASLIVFQPCFQTLALVALLLPLFLFFSSRDVTVARAT